MQLNPFELRRFSAEVLVGEGGRGHGRDQADRDHDQRAARGSAVLSSATGRTLSYRRSASSVCRRRGQLPFRLWRSAHIHRREWPAKTIALHGRSVSYREAGEGPALLLLHGMAGTAEAGTR